MTLLEMTLKAPGFKAYCRRRINGKSSTHAQRYAAACRAEQSKIRAFMKRRGPWTMLKEAEYTTGAMTAGAYGETPTMARLFYKAGEFNSEILNPAPIECAGECRKVNDAGAVEVCEACFKKACDAAAAGAPIPSEECNAPVWRQIMPSPDGYGPQGVDDDPAPLCEECGAPVKTTETGFTQLVCDSCYSKPAVNY